MKQSHFISAEVWNCLKEERDLKLSLFNGNGQPPSRRNILKSSYHYHAQQKAILLPACFTCVVWGWRVRNTLLITEQQNTKQIAKMLDLPLPFHGLTEFTLSLTTITLCHLGKQSEGENKHTCKKQERASYKNLFAPHAANIVYRNLSRVRHFCSVTQSSRTLCPSSHNPYYVFFI